jgi:two-component system chemotaxis sensor kinase CheA
MLVDLVGELVTVQARLSQKANADQDADLLNIAEVVERLTAELRDNAMSIRMMPFGTTFSKFRRLVRDLSNELGKQVLLTTSGGETELDKTVIEQLNDPLVHILRNSIDHGIEPPQVREAAGKPAHGTVHLSAEHSGAHVLIRISDDGAGLNVAAIRKTALARGLIQSETEKSDREIINLIFAPGFSTNTQVTQVSGRGVGMDVVKRGIESLRGSIDIENAQGQGAVISLKLPLTLAIIDGLLVETNSDKYVLPLSVIEECVELTREDVQRTHGRHILNIRGNIVPYVSLREKFQIYENRPPIEQVVISETNGKHIGIVVDRVIGQHQIVIKTMSKIYSDVDEISGATILGDGTIALVLDIARLIGKDEDEAKQAA